ncbi:MAG: FAD-dependent oxidoreductase, partial [Elusimicrobia bacterium]|nr:FAD-dependent oxidoreductase [Elusimicrobiota bacterium]
MPVKPDHKTHMPALEPGPRSKAFEEVNLGYDLDRAMFEAQRCLQCQVPNCEQGCPVKVPIREFIHLIAVGKFEEAVRAMKRANSLPAVCGRVCPQETQCEQLCLMAKRFQPVAVGYLERFIADWEMKHGAVAEGPLPERSERIAIVGSGPSGLTAAGDLRRLGYKVTVLEALHAPGGVLRYGIPEFRLPKVVLDQEIDGLKRLGVEFIFNVVVGRTLTVDDLFKEGYAAVFIGTGAGLPKFLGIPGENLCGVYSANEFLTRINLMHSYSFPDYDTP